MLWKLITLVVYFALGKFYRSGMCLDNRIVIFWAPNLVTGKNGKPNKQEYSKNACQFAWRDVEVVV